MDGVTALTDGNLVIVRQDGITIENVVYIGSTGDFLSGNFMPDVQDVLGGILGIVSSCVRFPMPNT